MRPITAQPGHTANDVIALLATKQFTYADCYTISNKDGTVLRYSTSQEDIVIATPVDGSAGPVTFSSRTAKISGLKTHVGIGVEVDEQTIRLDYDPGLLYNGSPYATAIRYGRFDGGVIRRDRYFCTTWGAPWLGGIPLFVGHTSTVDRISRSFAEIKVKSDLVLLKIPMPRKLFQPSCLHTLFDPGCGLVKSAFEISAVMEATPTATVIPWSGAAAGFVQGTVNVVDGSGVTLVRTIESVVPGVSITLAYPLESIPATGSNFKVYPGCVRSYARCGELGNQTHFQGFPFVPVAETAR